MLRPPGKRPAVEGDETTVDLVGTAFGSSDEEDGDADRRKKGKFVPLWRQEVTDEKGRRRLHGAFTGGFSAGYFNTVGSKEGWAPQTFRSSRGERGSRTEQRPEDFMDEEDVVEDTLGGKQLTAKAEYDTFGTTAEELRKKKAAIPVHGAASLAVSLQSIVAPRQEGVGIRLLKLMGWKEGQGIGARRGAKTAKKLYGCSLPPGHGDKENPTGFLLGEGTAVLTFQQKVDLYGVGYDPHAGADDVREMKMRGQKQEEFHYHKFGQGGGFGVGVFEDEDEDVFGGVDNPGNYNRELLDRRDKDARRRQRAERESIREGGAHPSTCSDGSLPLVGFVLATTSVVKPVWYKPPTVPDGFVGVHRFSAPLNDSLLPPALRGQKGVWTNLSAEDRSRILGEQQLPTAPGSVFKLLRPEDRAKLAAAVSGLTGEIQQPPQAATSTVADSQRQEALQRSAGVFGGLASRFVKEGEGQGGDIPATQSLDFGLTSGAEIERRKATEEEKRPGESEDASPATPAAKMEKTRNTMTRTVEDWWPTKLVCRRFNVPEPHGNRPPPPKKRTVLLDMPIPVSAAAQESVAPNAAPVESESKPEERPSMDLFKAIFEPNSEPASEDEEEEEEEGEEEEEEGEEEEEEEGEEEEVVTHEHGVLRLQDMEAEAESRVGMNSVGPPVAVGPPVVVGPPVAVGPPIPPGPPVKEDRVVVHGPTLPPPDVWEAMERHGRAQEEEKQRERERRRKEKAKRKEEKKKRKEEKRERRVVRREEKAARKEHLHELYVRMLHANESKRQKKHANNKERPPEQRQHQPRRPQALDFFQGSDDETR